MKKTLKIILIIAIVLVVLFLIMFAYILISRPNLKYNTDFSSELGTTNVKNIPYDYFPENSGHMFVIPDGNDTGKKMFYYDYVRGEGTPTETIVFVHGNPESSYAYKEAIDLFLEQTDETVRIIAMDHIGFGLSDAATYKMVNMHHSENLKYLIKYLELEDITLVVHDWGGPIGISALLEIPEIVSKLLITNTAIFPMDLDDGYTYSTHPSVESSWNDMPSTIEDEKWGQSMAALMVSDFMYRTDVSAEERSLGGIVIKGNIGILPEDAQYRYDLYKSALTPILNAQTSKQMNLESAVWGHGNTYTDETLGLVENYEYWDTMQERAMQEWNNIPVVAVIGRGDPLEKQSVIDQLIKAFPTLAGNVTFVEGGGHFVESRSPESIANALIYLSEIDN